MVERAALYVDGFNLYHAIDELNRPHLKWLNLFALGKLIIPQKSQELIRVVYCTAFYPGDEGKRWRHTQYINALMTTGVECIFGNYISEEIGCRNCSTTWEKRTEKETDINLALALINDAWEDVFDHAYLLTADSDQAATAKLLSKQFPNKKLTTVAPPNRGFSKSILNHTSLKLSLNEDVLERCLFPPVVINPTGSSGRRPREYEPPAGWVDPTLRPSTKPKA